MRSRALQLLGFVLVAALLATLTAQAQGAPVLPVPADPGGRDVESTALDHVVGQPDLFGLAPDDVADVVVTDVVAGPGGASNVHLQQRYRGIDVFGAVMNVTVDDRGEVVRAAGQFFPGVAKLAPSIVPGSSDVAAVKAVASVLGLKPTAPFERVVPQRGLERAAEVSDGGVSLENIPARLVYQPVRGGVRLAWEVSIYELDAGNWWQIRVDAATGEELDRNNLVTADSYNVYAQPIEAPSFGSRTIEVDPADPIASPFGWHDTDGVAGAEFTVTKGNNVSAYTDIDANNVVDAGSQPDGGVLLDFDFPLDLVQEPSTYRDAAVTNLFYWNNTLHDIFYSYGFDEAAGNFQTNAYGKGGVGGDAVLAEVQDGSATNNANFATPIDGFQSRMQMFVWDLTSPSRDSSLDSEIVAHEYGHGVSNRLTGGPNNVTCLQNGEQPGEGWSDYFALMATMQPGDQGETPTGFATYSLGQPPTGSGLRAFPYSTDLAVDPRTYGSVRTATIPHGVGSTFAAMLWELTWALIDRDGFDPNLIGGTGGNITAMQLVMDGLKLQPCAPGFVDARNAILLADQLSNGGSNECLIWQSFAKRGLGSGADQGVSASRSDGSEAFDVPPQCADIILATTATPDPAVAGTQLTYSIDVTNNTISPLTGVTVTDAIPTGSTYVPASADCGGSEALGVVTFPVGVLSASSTTTCSFAVTIDSGGGSLTWLDDDFEAGSLDWTLTHGVGSVDWVLDPSNAHSPTVSTFAVEGAAVSDQYLTTAAPIPVSANTTMRFWHAYDTENAWDGGVVEVSTDGLVWSDLGAAFSVNGYSGTLNTSANPLATRSAFTGDSGGYVESIADLSSFAGSAVQVRFRFGTDNDVAGNGWHVDDVLVRDEVSVSNTASVVTTEGPTAMTELTTIVNAAPGLLRVTTSPAVPSVMDVDGQWTDAFGLDWVETPSGAHEICYSDIPGFTTPPCDSAFVAPSATSVVEGSFVTHGTLDITSSPAVATTITVDGTPVNDWGAIVSIEAGSYLVCFGPVPDFDAPLCQTAVVTPGLTTSVVGEFVSNPGASGQTGLGQLRVTTSPAVPSQFLIDGTRTVSFGIDWVKLIPGTYEVCYTDVPGFSTPPCASVDIVDGVTAVVQGVFTTLAELRVMTSPSVDVPVTVDGRAIDQFGFWTWVPADVAYEICAVGYMCQTVTPPPGVQTLVTLIPS